jgi:hypothetical protein
MNERVLDLLPAGIEGLEIAYEVTEGAGRILQKPFPGLSRGNVTGTSAPQVTRHDERITHEPGSPIIQTGPGGNVGSRARSGTRSLEDAPAHTQSEDAPEEDAAECVHDGGGKKVEAVQQTLQKGQSEDHPRRLQKELGRPGASPEARVQRH